MNNIKCIPYTSTGENTYKVLMQYTLFIYVTWSNRKNHRKFMQLTVRGLFSIQFRNNAIEKFIYKINPDFKNFQLPTIIV